MAFTLILSAALSSLTLLSASAQETLPVAKLKVPEFTVTYSDHSYTRPPSTTTDPYTNKPVEVPAIFVEDRTLQFTIKNQPVKYGNLHFVIRMKPYFSQNWTVIYDGWAGWVGNPNSSIPEPKFLVWNFSTLRPHNLPGTPGRFYIGGESFHLPSEGKIDFQVKSAEWGEVMRSRSPQDPFGGSVTTKFAESDWSPIQTLSIPDGAVTAPTSMITLSLTSTTHTPETSYPPSSNGNQSPIDSIPQTTLLLVIVALVAVIVALSVLLLRRHNKTT